MKRLTFAALVLLSTFSASAERTVEQVCAEYNTSNAAFVKRYHASKTDEERKAALESRPSFKKFSAEVKPLLLARKDDPKIAEHAANVVYAGRAKGCEELIEIIAKHREVESLSTALWVAQWDKSGKLNELRDWARKGSPHEKVRAVAAFLRATQDKSIAQEEVISELKFAQSYPGELKIKGNNLKEKITRSLHEANFLAIGKPAPEIEGVDVDDEKFTLSSHRGKVVVLTFWGDW